MTRLGSLLVLFLIGCGGAQAPAEEAPPHVLPGAHRGHHFRDANEWARVFDDPARDEWQRPEDVVRLLGVRPGDVVVDLGAGTGHFLPHLSAAAGAEGRVLALDVEPSMVEHMRQRVEREGLANVEPRRVAPDDPGLEAESVDRILIVDTWHHIEGREAYAARLAAALRPSRCGATPSRILIVDFTADAPEGPPPAMRLSPEVVEAELGSTSLEVHRLEEELPRQYAIAADRAPPEPCAP